MLRPAHHLWQRPRPVRLQAGDAVLELAWAEPARATSLRWPSWLPMRSMLRWALAGTGATALCAVLGIAGARVLLHDAPPSAASARQDPLQALAQRLAESTEWKSVVLVPAVAMPHAQPPELRGHVQQRDMLERLLHLPEVAALAPTVRVLVEYELRSQVHELAGDSSVDVRIEDPPAGADATAPAQRQRVVVSGTTQRAGVPAALKLLNNEFGDRVEVVDRTIYAPGEDDRKTLRVELPFRIASINTAERYIESVDGAKYFEGSVVSGYRIETIGAAKVVFNVAGRRIEFDPP
jgi:hypothetical protein